MLPYIYEDATLGITNYSLDTAKLFLIPNAKKVVEVAQQGDMYSISYHSNDNEFVILEYFPNDTVNTYVRDSEKTDETATRTALPVTEYIGESESVIEYNPISNADSAQARASVKTVNFPTPEECGFTDTGSNGIVSTTQRVYISQLKSDLYARVVKYESGYAKQRSGWLSYGVNDSVAAIAAALAFPEISFVAFLSYAGVALSSISTGAKIREAIKLPQYPDYVSLDGKYGDILDTTVYNCYCRVYDNTGISKYVGGVLPNGTFTYVKKGYTGIRADVQVLQKTADMFNACIATNGNNTMYFPVN